MVLGNTQIICFFLHILGMWEKCSLFSKSNIPQDARFDGKETVGIIGVKPA